VCFIYGGSRLGPNWTSRGPRRSKAE
jgi:hypothetical protein